MLFKLLYFKLELSHFSCIVSCNSSHSLSFLSLLVPFQSNNYFCTTTKQILNSRPERLLSLKFNCSRFTVKHLGPKNIKRCTPSALWQSCRATLKWTSQIWVSRIHPQPDSITCASHDIFQVLCPLCSFSDILDSIWFDMTLALPQQWMFFLGLDGILTGLISKNTSSVSDKDTCKDPQDSTMNLLNNPLAPIGAGSSITRVNAGQWLLLFHAAYWLGTYFTTQVLNTIRAARLVCQFPKSRLIWHVSPAESSGLNDLKWHGQASDRPFHYSFAHVTDTRY